MKTTVEMSDDLYRRAKATAALRGKRLRDLVEEGLRLVVDGPRTGKAQKTLAELMEPVRGIVSSGIPDLASNPKHMEGFGSDDRRDR